MNGTIPAIGDYAMIGDCRTAALLSRDGSIDWLCLPHFSGPSVFAALLDQDIGGRFAIRPAQKFRASRRYIGASSLLETTFETQSGKARLIDVMPVGEPDGGLQPMREVLRVVEGIEGEVPLQVDFEPRPDYARTCPRIRRRGRLGWAATRRDELFLLQSEVPLEATQSGLSLTGRIVLRPRQKAYLSLAYVKGDIGVVPQLGAAAQRRLESTRRWWEAWSARCTYEGPYHEAVLRSAITLKLMTFALSGAVVAAPTASLPEEIGADRNWDYRYCWLRDAALTIRAFIGLGYHDEAAAFLQWLLHATRLTWPELQVMYDIYGRTRLSEAELDHLAGYRCSRPVRIGNDAHRQVQLDVYGGVVSAAFDYVAGGGSLQPDEARLLAGFGRTVCKRWREPDHGIWEIRGVKRHYTFSKVMCWLALDRLIKLHKRGSIRVDLERFRGEREAIAETIETRGYSEPLASYIDQLDGTAADASLLLMACLGYKQAAHPRLCSTLDHVLRRLNRNGLTYRYEPGYDGMRSTEGAFGICSFWAVDNLARCGQTEAAMKLFEHVLAFGNDLGLFAEEIDVESGQALGNFPQAFTHVGLIDAALALAEISKAPEPV